MNNDPWFWIVSIASFLAGLFVGGKYMLVLHYRHDWDHWRTALLGVSSAGLVLLVAPALPVIDLMLQLVEWLVGGAVLGASIGLIVFTIFDRWEILAPINLIMQTPAIFSLNERVNMIKAMGQKGNKNDHASAGKL